MAAMRRRFRRGAFFFSENEKRPNGALFIAVFAATLNRGHGPLLVRFSWLVLTVPVSGEAARSLRRLDRPRK